MMGEYRDLKTGSVVTIESEKEFAFPPTGAKILLKCRPPIPREVTTD
jgi:DNA-directed RNA polymerase subunit RPC12/RpoP